MTMSTQKPSKRQKSNPAFPEPLSKPTAPEPPTATVHDLVGAAMLMLPKELRLVLGEKLLQSNAQDLESRKVLVIVREPGVVAYVHLPIVVMEMTGDTLDLSNGGTTLRAITGTWGQRFNEELTNPDLVAVVDSAHKGSPQ